MKSFYFSLLLFLISFPFYGQVLVFPDAAFKNALVASPCIDSNSDYIGDTDADVNNDGEIDQSEASLIVRLYVQNQNITSLVGIEFFNNLQQLTCSGNPLGSLDLSGVSSLYYLECSNCQLTDLILQNLNQLHGVGCANNLLTTLDLSGTAVDGLDCSNNPNLVYINLKNGALSTCLLLAFSPPCVQLWGCPLQSICVDAAEEYLFPPNLTTTYCTLLPGGHYNTITGNFNASCSGITNFFEAVQVAIYDGPNNGSTYANAEGNFIVHTGQNQIILTPQLENPNYFICTPPNYTHTFTSLDTTASVSFCITPNGVHPDTEITILPLNHASPGFRAEYLLVFKNKGNQVQAGTVQFNFDDTVADLVTSSPTATLQNGGTLLYSFDELQPYESRNVIITLQLQTPQQSPGLHNGDVLHSTASITADNNEETPEDNSAILNQVVVGSYDPNDKIVTEGSTIDITKVGDYLHYMVRFQNTGTAAAETVIVKDLLPSTLDASTIQIIGASHPYRSTLTQGHQLEFFFEGIQLPPSATDEVGSHGFVAFKIKPAASVGLGSVIENSAKIYFDFNAPVLTNTTSTTVALLGTSGYTKAAFRMYPNPVDQMVTLESSDRSVLTSLQIYNVVGQVVHTQRNEALSKLVTVDVSHLPSGTYFVELLSDMGKSTQKIIKL